MKQKMSLFADLGGLLDAEGKIVNLVSSPEIYTHEWASFSTKDFPENKNAKSGDKVRIVITEIEDKRPVEDVVCSPSSYRKVFDAMGLEVVKIYKPLASNEEPYRWVNETRIAPWNIYVLKNMLKGSHLAPRKRK
jgi:hypothetical protein